MNGSVSIDGGCSSCEIRLVVQEKRVTRPDYLPHVCMQPFIYLFPFLCYVVMNPRGPSTEAI